MTAEVINLRRLRKAKLRARDNAAADANRIAHGRTKAERKATEAAATKLTKALDGAKCE